VKQSKLLALEEDLASLESGPAYHKGCRIEIDLDPNEDPERKWRNPTLGLMIDRLHEYLGQSQLPCKVYVNGVEQRERCRRCPVKRYLGAVTEQGSEVAFATFHLSQPPNARHKGKGIVRIDGAA